MNLSGKRLTGCLPWGDVTTRPMFGGHGVFLDGRMFALIAKDVLYFKANDENRGEFEAEGMKPYGKMPSFQTPLAAMDDPSRLEIFGSGAVAAAVRGDKKKSRGKKTGKS